MSTKKIEEVNVSIEVHVPKEIADHFNRIGFTQDKFSEALRAIMHTLATATEGDAVAQRFIARNVLHIIEVADERRIPAPTDATAAAYSSPYWQTSANVWIA